MKQDCAIYFLASVQKWGIIFFTQFCVRQKQRKIHVHHFYSVRVGKKARWKIKTMEIQIACIH